MKTAFRKTGSVLFKAFLVIVIIFVIPYAHNFWKRIFPDTTSEIRTQSIVLMQKLEASSRLEVLTVEEDGETLFNTNVILLGTVGRTSIRYRYTASIGIDLSRVKIQTAQDKIIFILPDPEILNDGVEAMKINKQNLLSYAIDKKTETMLQEIRMKCRNDYLTDPDHMSKAWDYTVQAFEKTVCEWLEDYGERHYQFVYTRESDQAAEKSVPILFALTDIINPNNII